MWRCRSYRWRYAARYNAPRNAVLDDFLYLSHLYVHGADVRHRLCAIVRLGALHRSRLAEDTRLWSRLLGGYNHGYHNGFGRRCHPRRAVEQRARHLPKGDIRYGEHHRRIGLLGTRRAWLRYDHFCYHRLPPYRSNTHPRREVPHLTASVARGGIVILCSTMCNTNSNEKCYTSCYVYLIISSF